MPLDASLPCTFARPLGLDEIRAAVLSARVSPGAGYLERRDAVALALGQAGFHVQASRGGLLMAVSQDYVAGVALGVRSPRPRLLERLRGMGAHSRVVVLSDPRRPVPELEGFEVMVLGGGV